MKKALILISLIILSLTLSGCSDGIDVHKQELEKLELIEKCPKAGGHILVRPTILGEEVYTCVFEDND